MRKFAVASSFGFLAALVAVCCMTAAVSAQSPPAGPTAQPTPGTGPDPNAALLAKASQLYYSSAKAGLKAFDCAVHPDWRTAIVSATPGTAVAEGDPRIVMLKTVGITLHGRIMGASSLDWNQPSPTKPLDQDSLDLLDHMHGATERTLTGFMQFWSPFIDGSVIPASSDGLEITHGEKGYTIHADQGGTSLTEILDNDMVMQQFNVVTSGAKIDFSPRYKSTDQGLLVNGFAARIQGPSDPPEKAQRMRVAIDYQTVSGFPVPSRIGMEMVGAETLNFTLDGCTVNPPAS